VDKLKNIEEIIQRYETKHSSIDKKKEKQIKVVVHTDGSRYLITTFKIDNQGLKIINESILKDNIIAYLFFNNIIDDIKNNNEKAAEIKKTLKREIENFKLYLFQNRSFNLSKTYFKYIRGLNDTKDKEILELDYKYRELNYNIPLISLIDDSNSDYVKTLIDTIFLNNQEYLLFIYEFIAQYVTEHRTNQRVAIILKGGRGIGKTLFIDILRMLFDDMSVRNFDTGRFNTHKANTKLIVYDEADSVNESKNTYKQLENIIKKDLGSSYQEIEAKGKEKEVIKSSFYLIIATNNNYPITISEKPINTKNNQFFVCDFKNVQGSLTDRLPKDYTINPKTIRRNLRAFINKYILTDQILSNLESYEKDNYRYGLNVPITKEELELVESTKTKVDRAIESMFDLIINEEIKHTGSIAKTSIIDSFKIDKKGYCFVSNLVISNLKKDNDVINSEINNKGFESYLKRYNIEYHKKSQRVRIANEQKTIVTKGYKIHYSDLKKHLKDLNLCTDNNTLEEPVL